MLLIGSQAMKHWWVDYPSQPKDTDFLVNEHISNTPEIEYFTFDRVNEILAFATGDVAPPDLLYTIKVSHLAWEGDNGKWWKHIKDVVFMQGKGCKLIPEAYQILYEEWRKRFGDKSHISLNKAADMFFKDGRDRKYNHDWLHRYFSIEGNPAYMDILKDGADVLCSQSKFATLSLERQLHTALEECFVVAFERKISFADGYKHLVTRLTKGWYNLFLIENASAILNGFNKEKQEYTNKRRILIKEKQL